ncbi:unnamed protein product, partial [Closterium sp. NIES-54]
DGTTVHRFLSNARLRDFFFILTTSFDKNGLVWHVNCKPRHVLFFLPLSLSNGPLY